MSATGVHPAGSAGGAHPAVIKRRMHDMLLAGVTGAVALALALGVAAEVPEPNLLLTLVIVLGALAMMTLLVSSRLEVTVLIVAFYLGTLDGPVKLFTGGGNSVAAIRDVLILLVSLGAIIRLLAKGDPLKLPPLSGWVLAFVALVLVEALNPNTGGTLKIAAGFRQQLEWVPFFFFGYALIRSKARLRRMFLFLSVLALVNGAVATYQSRLSPQQMAAWGPGYSERVLGTGGLSGTTYFSEGEGRVRPFALGSDIGFGGGVGMIGLPAALALFVTTRGRRKWLMLALAGGALLAVASSQSRSSVLGAVLTLISFGVLSLGAGRQLLRPLVAMLAVMALAIPLVAVLSSTEGSSAFARYASISPEKVTTTAPDYKEISLSQIPNDIAHDPFGFGLGTSGAASGFGGKSTVTLEGHGFSSETEYNFIMNELGLPGLALWVALTIMLITLVATRLRGVSDPDVRIDLAAVFAVIIGLTLTGFAGAFTAGQSGGPYFWFALGIAAWWFAGPGRGLAGARRGLAGASMPRPVSYPTLGAGGV